MLTSIHDPHYRPRRSRHETPPLPGGRDRYITSLDSMRNYPHLGILVLGIASIGLWFSYAVTPKESAAGVDFGGVSLILDYATTSESRERGLGGRADIPEDYGMLFVFPKDDTYGFWMKDTLVPLDLFWLDSKGHVVYILENVATSTYPHVFYPPVPARYVLETVAGFARGHAVATGAPLHLKNLPTVLK